MKARVGPLASAGDADHALARAAAFGELLVDRWRRIQAVELVQLDAQRPGGEVGEDGVQRGGRASMKLTPAATTSIATRPGPGCGAATSALRNRLNSSPPDPWFTRSA